MDWEKQKKQFEFHCVERLNAKSRLLDGYDINLCERPDLMVTNGDRFIGIEVTRLFVDEEDEEREKDSPSRARRSFEDKVSLWVQNFFRENSKDYWYTRIHFNHFCSITNPKPEKVAQKLVNIITSHDLKKGNFALRGEDYDYRDFPHEVLVIRGLKQLNETIQNVDTHPGAYG